MRMVTSPLVPGRLWTQTWGPWICPQQQPSWRDKERAILASSPCGRLSTTTPGNELTSPCASPSWHDALRAAVMAGKSAPAQRAALQAAGCGSSGLCPCLLTRPGVARKEPRPPLDPLPGPPCPVCMTSGSSWKHNREGLVQIEQVWWGFLIFPPRRC